MAAGERGGPVINIYCPNESLALTLTLFTEQEASGGHGVARPLLWVLDGETRLGSSWKRHTWGSAWWDGAGDRLRCFMMLLMATMCQSNEESRAPSQGVEMEVCWAEQGHLVSVCMSLTFCYMHGVQPHSPNPPCIPGILWALPGQRSSIAPHCNVMGRTEQRLRQGCGGDKADGGVVSSPI